MRLRSAFLLSLFCLGCHSFFETAPTRPSGNIPAAREGKEGARETTSLALSPPLSDPPAIPETKPSALGSAAPDEKKTRENRHLTLVALCLEQGRPEEACHHLGRFVEANPEHRNARFYWAEMLRRRERPEEAGAQFELVVAGLQEEHFLDLRNLIHCHSRLAELAEKRDDAFGRQLHRGIALWWLAQTPASSAEEEDLVPPESLLCKAAAALALAHQLDPEQARPCWYLHNVWRKLGQERSARRFLHRVHSRAAFSPLTPAEQRGLFLAPGDK